MIECGNEPNVLRKQHPVAKYIARHVAYPGDGEVLGLGVVFEFAEVSLDRFPSAPSRDSHDLVVVSDRPSGGESIAKPEAIFGRDTICDVGEGRCALVGSHHEVSVIAVMSYDPFG